MVQLAGHDMLKARGVIGRSERAASLPVLYEFPTTDLTATFQPAPIPELPTWGLMALGFASLGLLGLASAGPHRREKVLIWCSSRLFELRRIRPVSGRRGIGEGVTVRRPQNTPPPAVVAQQVRSWLAHPLTSSPTRGPRRPLASE